MWLIVGLGNPGRKYAANRHNIGFFAAEELARRHGITGFRDKFKGQLASGFVGSHKVHILKPMEYMNNSGFAVQRATQYLGIEPDHCVVVHDEIDLPLGRIRIKSGGGHGGHNGLRSIIDQLGSKDFIRVRLGVGRPESSDSTSPGDRVVSHVLSDFGSAEMEVVHRMTSRATDAIETLLEHGIVRAMNEFNTQPDPDNTTKDKSNSGSNNH